MINIRERSFMALAMLGFARGSEQKGIEKLAELLAEGLATLDDQDDSWPDVHCCRIYRADGFKGQQDDFCLGDAEGGEFAITNSAIDGKFEKTFDFGDHFWDNKMSSWKCGKQVAVKFCRLEDGVDCDERGNGESAAGYAESQDTGLDNEISSMVLTPYLPEIFRAITVFSDSDCHGDSAILWAGQNYNDTEAQLHTGNDIKSVMFPEGADWWVQLYKQPEFDNAAENAEQLMHDTSGKNDCVNVTKKALFTVDCTERNFADSVAYCEGQGATVASIRDQEENDAIQRILEAQGCPLAYTGAYRESAKSEWSWDDGSAWEYQNPGAGELNGWKGKVEQRMAIRKDGKWNDFGSGQFELGVVCRANNLYHSIDSIKFGQI